RARARRADAISENSFKYQRDNDCAPADENRGRIKIGDWRTLLKIHARNHAEGVNGKRKQKQIKCGTVERPAPAQPRETSQKESENIKRHALAERLKTIEQKLERCALRRIRLSFGEPIGHEIHMLIEERLIVCAVGVADDCVFAHDRMNFTDANGA